MAVVRCTIHDEPGNDAGTDRDVGEVAIVGEVAAGSLPVLAQGSCLSPVGHDSGQPGSLLNAGGEGDIAPAEGDGDGNPAPGVINQPWRADPDTEHGRLGLCAQLVDAGHQRVDEIVGIAADEVALGERDRAGAEVGENGAATMLADLRPDHEPGAGTQLDDHLWPPAPSW